MASTTFRSVFPEIYRATVSAGEQAGQLDAVLERLADYTENRQVTRQKVLDAMIYPIVLSCVCLGIVTLMLVYVVPKVVGVFEIQQGQAAARHPGADRSSATSCATVVSTSSWASSRAIVGIHLLAQEPDNRRRYHASCCGCRSSAG